MARSARPRSRKGATVVCADFDTTFLTNFTCPPTMRLHVFNSVRMATAKIDRAPDASIKTRIFFENNVQRRKLV